MKSRLPKFNIGPGALVAAAFIGPGTVTACTVAGATFGFTLVWALAFATFAAIILQDMAARLGAGAGHGLGEALLQSLPSRMTRRAVVVLLLAALALGNAAYEAGNLVGGVLGLEVLAGTGRRPLYLMVLGLCAGALLLSGQYRLIERILVGLVIAMSLAFLISAVLVRPDLLALLRGFAPRIPDGAQLTAAALIGTTIVPYNLFLHAASVRTRWYSEEKASRAVFLARQDSRVSIGIGGLVSILILSTAATALFGAGLEVRNAADMARGLEPVFGAYARYAIGIGLFAAGLTSAITAPLATGLVVQELFAKTNKNGDPTSRPLFRLSALGVLIFGMMIGLSGFNPITLILLAQAANALLLPFVAVFLIRIANNSDIMGKHANSLFDNIAGWLVVTLTFVLGMRGLLRVFGIL